MKTKTIILILSGLILIFGGYFVYDKYSFPVKYKICNAMYSDCSTVAKFNDMSSCKIASEMSGWYCDTVTDPTKPNCRVEKSTVAASFCSE